MKVFRDFVKGFKPKYRIAHDRSLGLPTASPAVVEVLFYEGYLRRMRITGEFAPPGVRIHNDAHRGAASKGRRKWRQTGRPLSCQRAKQTRLYQKSCHPSHPRHPRHERCLFPLPHLQPHHASRDRPR
ncbi:hypothetical protein BGW80DRAFT_1447422 [Lactifluus volemus]|nr:hypothetical protein BGW80DRAFT_1447422 [Lactifluus volemus]